MATKADVLAQLDVAAEAIATAAAMVQTSWPDEPPTDVVEVPIGADLAALIETSQPGTTFLIADGFCQDLGWYTFPHACRLEAQGPVTLTGIFTAAPDVAFVGITLVGSTPDGTILTGADRVTLDGCTLRGHADGQHRGILVNCAGMRIRQTTVCGIVRDIDTQAIAGWDGTDDLLVDGCYLEASGENVLFGGADSSSEARMPRNITIRGCTIAKRPEWRDVPGITCKNLVEIKCGCNIVVQGCTLDYSWHGGQIGYAIVLSVRNNDGTAPWSTIEDVTFDGNTIRHCAGGVQILGRDDRGPAYASGVMDTVELLNNRFVDLSNEWGPNGRQIFISGGPRHLTLDGNAFECPTVPNSALSFDQPEYVCEGLVIRNQQPFVEGQYGIFGTGAPALGVQALAMYAPGYLWDANQVLRSGNPYSIQWPPGTIFIGED